VAFPVTTQVQAEAALGLLRQHSALGGADHRIACYRAEDGAEFIDDDGEDRAGTFLRSALKKEKAVGVAAVVARWYGGVNIGKARFQHIQERVVSLLRAVGHQPGVALSESSAQAAWASAGPGHSLGSLSPSHTRHKGTLEPSKPGQADTQEDGHGGKNDTREELRRLSAAAAERRLSVAAAAAVRRLPGTEVAGTAVSNKPAEREGPGGKEQAHDSNKVGLGMVKVEAKGAASGKGADVEGFDGADNSDNASREHWPVQVQQGVEGPTGTSNKPEAATAAFIDVPAPHWACGQCTLRNAPQCMTCDVCDAPRPWTTPRPLLYEVVDLVSDESD